MNKLSGFIEKEINGRPDPVAFKFGMNTFARFCEIVFIPLSELETALSEDNPKFLSNIIILLFVAASEGETLKGRPVNFVRANVGEWLEEMSQPDFLEIIETVKTSKFLGKSLNQAADKKKPRAKKK